MYVCAASIQQVPAVQLNVHYHEISYLALGAARNGPRIFLAAFLVIRAFNSGREGKNFHFRMTSNEISGSLL